MKLDAYASETNYADHLIPIWRALDPELRGDFFGHSSRIVNHLAGAGIEAIPAAPYERPRVMVASYRDERRTRSPKTRYVFVEHGAGQNYGRAGDGSYAGDPGRELVEVFISPNPVVAERNRDVYPNARHAIVGVPKLDPWHGDKPAKTFTPNVTSPTIALAFHWPCKIVPEADTAFRHYERHLGALVAEFGAGNVLGHGHPKAWAPLNLEAVYRRFGIEPVYTFEEVLERADLLAVDNSSVLYEFASVDRPVLVLNSPAYRRDVHHGLRFWDLIPGLQVDHPLELVDAAHGALEDNNHLAELRRSVVSTVYPLADGNAAKRAAEEVNQWLY